MPVFAYAYLADPGGTHFRWKDITRRLLLYLTNDNVLNYHSRHLMALLMWMSSYSKLEPEMRFRYMTVGAVNLVKISDVLNSRPLPHTPRSHNRALHTRSWKKCQTRRYHTPHL
ncbi:hypothetical protein EB796_024173 [Bugula neritina]|uniref:Uncharacterized protein n=1 Tax=Bugula neritina TaxID=10212 RepID=A0A7J7IVE7_BUGNE|nr:hypothetical protein EB796_024173 [Bugula neritina]